MEPTISAYLLYAFVGLAVWKLAHFLWTIKHIRQFMSKYPGPKGIISIWILKIFTHKFNFLSLAKEIQRYYKSKNICLWVANYPFLLTSDPIVISQICSTPTLQNKSKLYTHIKKDLGNGLVFISGEEWRHHRKALNPAFSNSTVMHMIEKFNTAKDIATSEMNQMAEGIEHNLEQFILYISARTAFDTNLNTVLRKNEVFDYIHLETKCIRQAEWSAVWRLLNVPFFSYFNKNFEYNMLENKKLLRKILHQKMESSTRENVSINADDVIKKTPKVMVDQLIERLKTNEISFDDILAENTIFLSAAYGTTALTIFSVLVMLAMHPEVQERVFEEILDIFPEKDFAVTYEHIQELKYLDMVINETMRVCPAVPYILRDVTENTPLKDGLMLPKGLQVLMFIYNLHRDESVWGPDAEKFNPDHFLPENIKIRNPHAFMPFSKGSRNCIGWRYAQMLMNIVLPGLIRNFKFSTDYKYEDLKFNNSIAMYYVEVPLLKIQRRI